VQLYGTLSGGLFTFVFAFSLMYLLKVTIGIRVSEEEEEQGLDIAEHDMEAYEEGTVTDPAYQLMD
jgi:Amt family ammonium transporter